VKVRHVPNEHAMVGQHFLKIFFHNFELLAVSFGDDRSFAVHVEENGERAEMISTTQLTRYIIKHCMPIGESALLWAP